MSPDQILAAINNILSWLFSLLNLSHLLIKRYREEEDGETIENESVNNTECVVISRPGGMEQLRNIKLKKGICTVGYNLRDFAPPPFSLPNTEIPSDCIVLRNHYFSVNYADCCIRWGLYESANRFVGWPIIPGFDVAGVIESVGSNVQSFKVGDEVIACTFFGGYSSRIVIPQIQVRKIPQKLSLQKACSLPAVSLTALYALYLAGHYPRKAFELKNKAILIHSAAGGVGGMLVQMAKILELSPIVGVVGRTEKVQVAKELGCDIVISKEQTNDLWGDIRNAASKYNGLYGCVMDANGVSTLQDSYDHLAQTGRLIVFGFHTNIPIGKSMLSPMEWLKMGWKMVQMPKFDPLDLCTSNKAVLGFNLSFFSDEREFVSELFDQVLLWVDEGKLACLKVSEFAMKDVTLAHEYIQSGKSVGKIVVKVTRD